MIDPAANEAALRHLAREVERLQLLLAQAVGNLALARKRIAELEAADVATAAHDRTQGDER